MVRAVAPDDARLVLHGARHRLPDPPVRIGREFESAGGVKALRALGQPAGKYM